MDAVIACDRLAHTVLGGSVERVVEEVIERGVPIPQHAQHLRVLVRDASLGPGQVLWSGVIVLCPSGWVMR